MSVPDQSSPQHLTDDDLEYHHNVLRQQMEVDAVTRSWSNFLANKYRLGPNDHVNAQGAIIRGQQKDEKPTN
jgi:hypothetical protein